MYVCSTHVTDTREHCETPMHKRRAALTCCISFCCSSMILFSSPLLRRWMWSKERASACTDTYIHTYISADQQPYCLPSFHSAHQCPTHIAPPTNTPPTNLHPQTSTHLQPLQLLDSKPPPHTTLHLNHFPQHSVVLHPRQPSTDLALNDSCLVVHDSLPVAHPSQMTPCPPLEKHDSPSQLLVVLLCVVAAVPLLNDGRSVCPPHSLHHPPDQPAPSTLLDKDGRLPEAKVLPPLQPRLDVLLDHDTTAV